MLLLNNLWRNRREKLLGKKDVENQVGFSYTAKMWSEGKGGESCIVTKL